MSGFLVPQAGRSMTILQNSSDQQSYIVETGNFLFKCLANGYMKAEPGWARSTTSWTVSTFLFCLPS